MEHTGVLAAKCSILAINLRCIHWNSLSSGRIDDVVVRSVARVLVIRLFRAILKSKRDTVESHTFGDFDTTGGRSAESN